MNDVSTALVTGGAGFVGSHLVEELMRRQIETYVIDDFSTGSIENTERFDPNLVHVIRGGLREALSNLPKKLRIDVVFHEAAIASVPRSVQDPAGVHDVNVNMSLDLMNYCVKNGIRRFVFASSAAVYGVLGSRVAEETIVCEPASPYGAGKLSIEDYLHAYRRTFGLEPVMLRYFNIFGPRQKFSDYSGVITIFAQRMLAGLPVTIMGDGCQTRDFVNVRDIVEANILAMESDEAVGQVFNVASGRSITILELYETLKQVVGKEIGYEFAPARPGDVKDGRASIKKIQNILGYEPHVTLADGLDELVNQIRRDSDTPRILSVSS